MWHYEEMATFCAYFPWCSPDRFWRLTMTERAALLSVMEAADG